MDISLGAARATELRCRNGGLMDGLQGSGGGRGAEGGYAMETWMWGRGMDCNLALNNKGGGECTYSS